MKNQHGEKHHRKCRSKGGGNEERNISVVSSKKHDAWHCLFENKDAEDIAKIINDTWIDPDFVFIPVHIKGLSMDDLHSIIRKMQKAL